MTTRITTFLLASLLIASCATTETPVETDVKEQDILYIYADGTMEFDGRLRSEEDVIIYDDGRGGERAAVKIIVPSSRSSKEHHESYYRDSIEVERIEIDVPVVRKK